MPVIIGRIADPVGVKGKDGNLIASVPNPFPVEVVGGTITFPAEVEIKNDVGNPLSIIGSVDVTDRLARILGHVQVDNFPSLYDVSDRVGRLLGHVTIDNATLAVTQSGSWSVNQGSPNTLANGWPVKLTDGTNAASINSNGTLNTEVYQGTNPVSSSNPMWVQGSVAASGATLNIVSALSTTNYNLTTVGGYPTTASGVGGPYILDNIKFKFSTNVPRDITVKDVTTGTILFQKLGSTDTDLVFKAGIGMPSGHQFNVTVSQTASTCLMTFEAEIQNGQLPMGGNPVLASPAENTYIGDVQIAAGRMLDAGGRLRVASKEILFDHQHRFDVGSFMFGNYGTGTTTFDYNNSGVVLATGGTTSGLIQTHIKHAPVNYQPGSSQLIKITGVLGAAVTNVSKRMGLTTNIARGDAIYLSQQTGQAHLRIRSSTSGSSVDALDVAQSAWNMDTMLGTGGPTNPSGYTLDLTKNQVFVIDGQWMSAGILRFGFEINGLIYYVHTHQTGNVLANPFVRTFNMRPFWQIENTGVAGSSSSLLAICIAVASEGGRSVKGRSASISTGNNPAPSLAAGATATLISIRPKLTHNTFVNAAIAKLREFSIVSDKNIKFQIRYFPTFTGGTWADVGGTSMMEYSLNTTASGGDVFQEDFLLAVSGGGNVDKQNELLDETSEIMSLTGDDAGQIGFAVVVTNVDNQSAVAIRAAIRWLEEKE